MFYSAGKNPAAAETAAAETANEHNETYYPKPVEQICYHCRQSAEKAIKALMICYSGYMMSQEGAEEIVHCHEDCLCHLK